MSKKALVTGASRGIGREIANVLLEEGYEVYGIGRRFSPENTQTERFHPVVLDLLDEKKTEQVLKEIPREDLCVLVNNAGSAYYGMHETVSPEQIRIMTRTDLEIPMVLTQKFLRDLRRNHGTVINIASAASVSVNTHGAAYGAAKAGLLSFSNSLFEENRKFGLKVTAILPDMTQTDLYRNADFEADSQEGCSLLPEDVAETVRFVLHQREGAVVQTVLLKPQFHRIRRKKQ